MSPITTFPHSARTVLSRILLITLALSGICAAQAQLIVTITATANTTAYGYTTGDSYTFTYLLNSDYAANTSNVSFDSSSRYWNQETMSDTALFTNVYSSGLTGSFAPVINSNGDPYAYMMANSSGELYMLQGTDTNLSIGLSTADGSTSIIGVYAYLQTGFLSSASYSTTEYLSPASFLSSYVGTYAVTGTVALHGTNWSELISFAVTSVTISNLSAVPEPATYAALAGLGALGLVIWRRRRAAG